MQKFIFPQTKAGAGKWVFLVMALIIGTFFYANAQAQVALTVMGVDNSTSPPTETALTDYRWLIEEDQTYKVQRDANGEVLLDGANNPVLDPNWRVGDPLRNTLSVSFHRSFMPVVAKGSVGTFPPDATSERDTDITTLNLDPTKNYHVSVIPAAQTHSIGGAPIEFDGAGNASATVYLNQTPIPTAQITIFVFEDTQPINNAPDAPEQGLGGFQILVEDSCGKYGACAGAQSQDAFGNPLCGGNCVTDANGMLTIKNLAPGKYGIQAVPPAGSDWQQTSTIEGKKVIDAWVKANEPPFFGEFGPPGFHVFIGFVQEFNEIPAPNGTSATISGDVVNLHISRPPGSAFYTGGPIAHTNAWVGLNDNAGLAGATDGIYVARTVDNSFSIPNVPPGDYQLVIFDDNMDTVFAFQGVTVNPDGSCATLDGDCDLGDVGVFQWFTRLENEVFTDLNENGFRDPGEPPIIEQAVLLRWRDGTVYQEFPTDGTGFVPFDEIFPFFSWLVAEVDFARFKATGVTVTVDDGGPVPFGDPWAFGDQLNPQVQDNPTDPDSIVDPPPDNIYRVEEGPVLTEAFQGFLGMTSVMQWGKTSYGPGPDGQFFTPDDENGGISGVVYYAITRAEDDPALAAVEPWEPGIPRVQVALYQDSNGDGIPDDRNGNGNLNLTDVDNYPLNWAPPNCLTGGQSCLPGDEDVDRNGNGNFNIGDAIVITTTDSWDDSLPENCQYGLNDTDGIPGNETDDPFVFRGVDTDCYDGLRNFNQVRPAVFDGGYAFTTYFLRNSDGRPIPPWSGQAKTETPLPAAIYIVEASPPPAYEIAMPEDRNVDFGDDYIEVPPDALPPPCVGDDHPVPAMLTLFPGVPVGSGLGGLPYPLCDRKQVPLSPGQNAAADFQFFTEVPIAGHFIGFILDDTANEFDPTSPQFGEKFAPPFLPVSIRDWTGREISRTYSDEFGRYNALVPSTVTANLPQPSGMSPNMLITCMNDSTLSSGQPDPLFNPQYSTFCYTFQYMPGSTTYLDTPVVPTAAFAGPDQFPLDCEFPHQTPRIRRVTVSGNGVGGGPYIDTTAIGNIAGGQTITIRSFGNNVAVPNPTYCPAIDPNCAGMIDNNKTITRNYGFGPYGTAPNRGTVTIGDLTLRPMNNSSPNQTNRILSWNNNVITANIGPGDPTADNRIDLGPQQLMVTRANGTSTITGLTVQVGLRPGAQVVRVPQDFATIQAAIDAPTTMANDLILVRNGNYNEMVIMWKPVQLQGYGPGVVTINAVNTPFEKLQAWRDKVDMLIQAQDIDLLPGQEIGANTLPTEEGAGVIVLSKATGPRRFRAPDNRGARIDGFTIIGAATGGGIVVNGYGDFVEIGNNVIRNNSGFYQGGIRLGHPTLMQEGTPADPCPGDAELCYTDADNDFVNVHHNQIAQNGGRGGAGGGVSLCTGSDNYQVTENWVCGNFSLGDGAGIGHLGLSNNGLIADNSIFFNENFNQGLTVNGGGVFIGGQPPLAGDDLGPGSGRVDILSNLIQGNSAGAGDGGGIRLSQVNGQDVDGAPGSWNFVDIFNNMIVNNVAGLAGGGISISETARVRIIHNTVANNDSTATAANAFAPGVPNQSNPQPAGIVARGHSDALSNAIDAACTTSGSTSRFCDLENPDPTLTDNIIWHNRSFYFMIDPTQIPATTGLVPDLDAGDDPVFDDLAVLGTATTQCLRPVWNVLTNRAEDAPDCGYAGNNLILDPAFAFEYFNGGRGTTVTPGEPTTNLQVPAAFDEGGNFIRVGFGPLTLGDSDYHITGASSAVNADSRGNPPSNTIPELSTDFDAEPRPFGPPDFGADELQ